MVACTNSAKRPVFRLTSKLGEFKNFCMKSSTFNILLHFLQVFLSVLFLKKYQKRGQSCTAFDASFVQESLCDIFQSVHISSFAACRNAWGGKNSRCSNIMPPVSKHCSTALCASQRCPLNKLLALAAKSQTSLAFARLRVTFRPWRGITFCNESPIAHFTAYYGNIKETPAPLKITA